MLDRQVVERFPFKISNIRQISTSGMMSVVYQANSSKGNVVIHEVIPFEEQLRTKTFSKLARISKINPLPSAKVFFCKKVGSKYYIVQEKIVGEVVSDTKKVKSKIISALKKVHSKKLSNYGFLDSTGKGSHKTWKGFLRSLINVSLQKYNYSEKKYSDLRKKYYSLLEKINYNEKGRLIHGDMVNAGNIIKSSKELIFIDYEWALSGDPAFEFSRGHSYDFTYSSDLYKRAKLYEPIMKLWVSAVVGIKTPLGKKRFKESLELLENKFKKLEDF